MMSNIMSQDDSSIPRKLPSKYRENVDYMSSNLELNNFHLYQCWKQNNTTSIKTINDDISFIIPSTVSKRLENVCWRRWFKNLHHLREIPPTQINWCKDQDITWLYGPKFESAADFELPPAKMQDNSSYYMESRRQDSTSMDILRDAWCNCLEVDDGYYLGTSVDSITSSPSLLSSSRSSPSLYDSSMSKLPLNLGLRSALKKSSRNRSRKKKSVKFNHVINSREIINSMHFDYNFLDNNCFQQEV